VLQEHGQVGHQTTDNPQGMDMVDGGLLVGVSGRLFEVGMSFQCTESIDPFTAIGSAAQIACGALHALRNQFRSPVPPPEQQLQIALEAAARFNASIRPPFTIVATN
jgi:hypothetical protein